MGMRAGIRLSLMLLCLTAACGSTDRTGWSGFETIGEGGWDPLRPLVFEPVPRDSARARHAEYALDLVVRYSGRIPFRSLPVAVEWQNSEGTLRVDTLSLPLFNPDGTPCAEAEYGLCTLTVPLDSCGRYGDGTSVTLNNLGPKVAGVPVDVGLVLRESAKGRSSGE